jgi:membrane protein
MGVDTSGALTATLLWLAASLAFRVYVVNFGNYEEAYGTLGAIILVALVLHHRAGDDHWRRVQCRD